VTCFARDVLDLDLAVVDFGHFVFEQAAQHVLMCPTDHNLRAAAVLLDLSHVRAHLVVRAIALAGDLLRARHDGLGAAQAECDRAAGNALDGSGHQVALALDKFVVQRLALSFANALQDDLLGRLRGDSPKRPAGLNRDHHRVAELRLGMVLAGDLQRDFSLLVLDRFGHFFLEQNLRTAGWIDDGFDVLVGGDVGVAPVGGDQGLRQRFQHHLARQRARFHDFVKSQGEVTLHGSVLFCPAIGLSYCR